jgi:hypothetical protein
MEMATWAVGYPCHVLSLHHANRKRSGWGDGRSPSWEILKSTWSAFKSHALNPMYHRTRNWYFDRKKKCFLLPYPITPSPPIRPQIPKHVIVNWQYGFWKARLCPISQAKHRRFFIILNILFTWLNPAKCNKPSHVRTHPEPETLMPGCCVRDSLQSLHTSWFISVSPRPISAAHVPAHCD